MPRIPVAVSLLALALPVFAEPPPGYGVVESVTAVSRARAEESASAGATRPPILKQARQKRDAGKYLVRVRMDDGSVQVRTVKHAEVRPGERAFITNAGDVVLAQDEPRGTVPPGTAADGSRPAEGAIKGGTILPGERAGTPERRISRCDELSGTLRDDCLRREQDASTGGSNNRHAPKSTPPAAPPPQNPR